jgi:hypothetical protein
MPSSRSSTLIRRSAVPDLRVRPSPGEQLAQPVLIAEGRVLAASVDDHLHDERSRENAAGDGSAASKPCPTPALRAMALSGT